MPLDTAQYVRSKMAAMVKRLPPEGGRKADAVARELMARIVGGEVAVGSILPKEEELEREFGVARSVIREATKFLEVHRLVRPVRRRGTVVLDPRASLSPDVVATFLTPRKGRVARDFLKGLLEVRRMLDVEMLALAAQRRKPSDVRALKAAADGLKEAAASGDAEAFEAAILGFGLAAAAATHNPIYTMLVHWNASTVRELADVFASIRSAPAEHAEGVAVIVAAIERGDAAAVRELGAAFHDWAEPKLLAAL